MPVELTIDQQALQALARALSQEAGGKQFRRDLAKGLRASLDPVKAQARSNLMGVASAGLPHGGSPLRASVADQIKAEARLSGRSTGARLRVRRARGMPRGFANAPKALSSRKGWRHRVFGSGVWVQQFGRPSEWFDRATREHHDEMRAAVVKVMNQMAERIAAKGPFRGRR